MKELTVEQILNMPAGREMDALIAENVFGYVWVSVPQDANGENAGTVLMSKDEKGLIDAGKIDFPKTGMLSKFWSVPCYSTDRNAARDVYEKMHLGCTDWNAEPEFLMLNWYPGGMFYFAKIWAHHDGEIIEFEVEAETDMLAIGRGALIDVYIERPTE